MTRSDADDQAQGPPGEPPLVAIVDDDASVRNSAGRLIRSFGYRAEVFASGEEFLASPVAAQTGCLLLDVRMPDMDGLEVQRRVTARGLAIPVIFVSGRASDDEERRARSAGAIDFLRKPIARETLLRVLRKAFSRGEGDHDDDV
ncbi:MAG TPA: response regulator [Candidatus Eisenbacteria bacterium]|nr:response regulator [Candidatus Eisenbacteria bacterium]